MVGKIKGPGNDMSWQSDTPSTLRNTVRILRSDSLKCEDGALMGSEDQLLARYGISRPTLRKAAAMVAQEQLLRVRRGVGGGYIATRPTTRAVAHMAAIYLNSRNTDVDAILSSVNPIRGELSRLAAKNLDPQTQQDFANFLEADVAGRTADGEPFTFAKSEREFGRLLGIASGNLVLALFLEILHDLSATIERKNDIFFDRPDRVAAYREQRRRLVQSIISQEPDLAMLLSQRISEVGRKWWQEDSEKADKTA